MNKDMLGVALAAFVFAAPAVAQDASNAAVDALPAPTTPDWPGIAFAIHHAGKVKYGQGYGLAIEAVRVSGNEH